MDIRSWGQSFLTRIKNLPASGGNLTGKAQAALQDLPKSVEDGAKAVLANEQVAEGWRTVGKGFGELTGWHSDNTNISGGAKNGGTPEIPPASGKVTQNPSTEIPAGKPSGKPGAHGTVTPDPAVEPGKTPRVRPRPKPVDPAPAKPIHGVKPTVAPKPAPLTPVEPGTVTKVVPRVRPETPAQQVIKGGAKVPVKVSGFDAKKPYASVATHASERAKLLESTGHPAEAQEMRDFSARMKRAQALYKQGNTPAASRMLHAKIKIGLRNPELQEAVRVGNKAEEVTEAFKPQVAKPFASASEKMLQRAAQLKEMGHPAEAKQLTTFANKLTKAGEEYASGNKNAAFKLFRQGLGKTQGALKVSDKADEVFAAFGKAPKGAKGAATVARATKQATSVAETATAATKTVTRAAKGAKQVASAVESGGGAAQVLRSATGALAATQVAEKGQVAAKATRTATSAARVAKGAKTATQTVARASKGAQVAERASTAAESSRVVKVATQVAEKGQVATKATRTAATAARVTKGAKTVKGAVQAGKTAGAVTEAGEAAATAGKAAKGAVGAAEAGAQGAAKGFMGGVKGFFSKIGDKVKGLFGKAGGTGATGGWATIKEGFAKMLPGIGKAMQSGAIFSAVFSLGENLWKVFKGERTLGRAISGVFGDTVGGALGSAFSALASGAAIAGLGALGVVGLPLTLAAGAIGIVAFMGFDRFFRNSSIYDWLTHMFT